MNDNTSINNDLNTNNPNENILNELKKKILALNLLKIADNKITYGDRSIDINNFDLSLLLSDDFVKAIADMKPDELFNAIEKKVKEYKGLTATDKWKQIISENPFMKNITIFNQKDKDTLLNVEYINIYTSDGKNHLYRNDIGMDIFVEYNKLKAMYGNDITPEMLVNQIEKWKKDSLSIEKSDSLIENSTTNESFKNKLREIRSNFEGKEEIVVEANMDEEIVYINNREHPDLNVIVTFDKDINGELVMKVHKNNVNEITSSKVNPSDENEVDKEVKVDNIVDLNDYAYKDMKYKNSEEIMDENTFYELLNVSGPYSKEDREKVDKFYKNIQERINNKDSSIEGLMKNYGEKVEEMQLSDYTNERQEEAINNFYTYQEMLDKTKGINTGKAYVYEPNKVLNTDEDNNNGYSNSFSVIFTMAMTVLLLGVIALVLLTK